MTHLKESINTFGNWITRENVRHNLTLRQLLNLSKSIEDFTTRYRLQKDTSFNTLFGNIGQARIDATEIAHTAGTIVKNAKNFAGKNLLPAIAELHNELEEFKRSLFIRTLSGKVLSEHVLKMDIAFQNLLTAISDIEPK